MKKVLPVLLVALTRLPGAILINEINYDPREKAAPEEFVELYNAGDQAVDLSGWHFTNAFSFTFAEGTIMLPGAYLVVAQDPQVLTSRYGAMAVVGPWVGRLANESDRIVLRRPDGQREDTVDYQRGFPWPTAGGQTGLSIELINPALDNDLGGSWRPSDPGSQDSTTLVRAGSEWRYFKGTSEASSPDRTTWRTLSFSDGTWSRGNLPIGYGEAFIATTLNDMQGGYSSVFLRKTFEVPDAAAVGALALEVQYDDGFIAWINGTFVALSNVDPANVDYNDLAINGAREDADYESFALPRPVGAYLRTGTNVLAIQFFNINLSTSSDAFLDARLTTSSGAGSGPTPGTQNTVYAATCPPQVRQVSHTPAAPRSNEPVVITVKATDDDGVASVELAYQVVAPGSYIELSDAAYETTWTALGMNDTGADGDAVAGDSIYSVTMPAALQRARYLIRYRITAADTKGASIRAPYLDDPQPNFAYFVYDGAPAWSGAIEPGSADANRRLVVNYSAALMNKVPLYILITKRAEAEEATWYSKYMGDLYQWHGTLVYDGEVYDHIDYRMRGGVWRYSMGKNMWKFNFHPGRSFRARDDWGRPYATTWDKLNFSAIIQQGDYLHRGEQGLFEATGFKLFNLVGVEASKTHYVTFRIIDDAGETGATQYDGDFWGLYLILEQMDGRFLDEHGLPDGNMYKMEGGTGELNNQGLNGATDKSDLNSFMSAYQGNPSDQWWRANLDLERYYGYRSIVEGIHHYDIGDGKNYFYFLNPDTNMWSVHPWDLDLTWADTMYGSGNSPFKSRVLPRADFSRDYKNRLREIRDLLFNTDQTYRMIEEFAAMVDDPLGGPSLVDADRARWDYNPIMINSSIVNLSKAGQGRYYRQAATRDFPGMAQIMKSYVVSRGTIIDSQLANDAAIPNRPTVTYTGPAGYPLDRLTFRSSAFNDPQGAGTFGGMKWRIAEVTPAGAPAFDPAQPRRYEMAATWESEELAAFSADATIPWWVVATGNTYRVRVRMKDATGRWSQWSPAVEFAAGAPETPLPHFSSLRVTEIMFNPLINSDYEFIEIKNVGEERLDLTHVAFTDGIDFKFGESPVAWLDPGEYVLLVNNLAVFSLAYDTTGMLIAGEYGARLADDGERLVLSCGANTILDFTYVDAWHPEADGGGYSLTIVDPLGPIESWNDPDGWRPSAAEGGSPGSDDGAVPNGRQLPGDGNQDGTLDISDAVAYLRMLFHGSALSLPCGATSLADPAMLALLDVNGSGSVNVADPVYVLAYLFSQGPAPAQGTACVRIEGCPNVCRF